MIQTRIHFFVNDLLVVELAFSLRVPIDHSDTAIDMPFVVEVDETEMTASPGRPPW